jgi:hypothetical protein
MTRWQRVKPEAYVAPPATLALGILVCLLFVGVGFYQLVPSLAPWLWPSAKCRVLQCDLTDSPDTNPPFSAKLLYQFEWNGKTHQGTQLGIPGWKHAADGIRFAIRVGKNPETRCFLPGGDPSHAVLIRPKPKWGALTFSIFGLCIIWSIIQAHRQRDSPPQELSSKVLPPIAILFGGTGAALTLFLSLPVWIGLCIAPTWNKTPATIIWSTIRTTETSETTKHHADICYQYQLNGRTWRNNCINPAGLTSAGNLSAAEKLIATHPPGTRITCLVHPTDPSKACLTAKPSPHHLLTLFPLPFLAIGILCLKSILKKSPKPHKTRHPRPPRRVKSW